MTREDFINHVEATQETFRRFLVALCCGDSALADDIAQESYVKAWLALESLRNHKAFAAWIRRIGYSLFISHCRSTKIYSGLEQADDKASPYITDSVFQYEDLYRALDTLSPAERSAILLFYMEGYSIKEIAEIQNQSESAIKQYLSRGRGHLRKSLLNS